MVLLRWVVACINWPHPDAPHAIAYLWDGVEMRGEIYFDTWTSAIEHVDQRIRRYQAVTVTRTVGA